MKIPLGKILLYKSFISSAELVKAMDLHTQFVKVHKKDIRLGEFLIGMKLITQEQLAMALKEQDSLLEVPIGQILLSEGVLTQVQLDKLLAQQKATELRQRKKLGDMVVEQRLASSHQIERALFEYYKKMKQKQQQAAQGLNIRRK